MELMECELLISVDSLSLSDVYSIHYLTGSCLYNDHANNLCMVMSFLYCLYLFIL